MIAVRRAPAITRPLAVLLDLAPDGSATVTTDAQDSDEFAEAVGRLRRWIDRRAVDELIGEAEGGGRA